MRTTSTMGAIDDVDFESDALPLAFQEIGLIAGGSETAAAHRQYAGEHDLKRRQFANNADAVSAAQMLESALGLLSSSTVREKFEPRMLRRVDYHFDKGSATAATARLGRRA